MEKRILSKRCLCKALRNLQILISPIVTNDWSRSYVGEKEWERKPDRHIRARTLRILEYIARGPVLYGVSFGKTLKNFKLWN